MGMGNMELSSIRTWLRPGMMIKRWILLVLLSLVIVSLGLAMGLTWAYRSYYSELEETTGIVRVLTLQFIAHPYREILAVSLGVSLMAFALFKLSQAVLGPLMALASVRQPLAQIVAEHRFGPSLPELKVVAIGGGTGLSSLLRGLKRENIDITAIVTVADDGGSTGRIRKEFDIPAPGDLRNCIVALADDESLVSELFQYRFERAGSALTGHSLGNLFITALTDVTGSFEQAILEFGRVVNIRGRVLPATLENVNLCARLDDGSEPCGESQIGEQGSPIQTVYLDPSSPAAYPPALEAIVDADVIVLGPGSLYTSVIPNLLVDGIVDAIRWSRGRTVYVCNVATQSGETDGYTAADHVEVLEQYLGPGNLDYVIVNSNRAAGAAVKPDWTVEAVYDDDLDAFAGRSSVIAVDVVNDLNPLRHDPEKLTQTIMAVGRRPRSEGGLSQTSTPASAAEVPVAR